MTRMRLSWQSTEVSTGVGQGQNGGLCAFKTHPLTEPQAGQVSKQRNKCLAPAALDFSCFSYGVPKVVSCVPNPDVFKQRFVQTEWRWRSVAHSGRLPVCRHVLENDTPPRDLSPAPFGYPSRPAASRLRGRLVPCKSEITIRRPG